MASGEPYVGIRPYDVGDQDRFFGRDQVSIDLAAMWEGNRLTVVYGPSGIGKTSLLRSGVVPRFSKEAADILGVGRVSHTVASQLEILPEHNPYELALVSSWSPHESPVDLAGRSIAEFLAGRRILTGPRGEPLPVLAAIDHFEEIFVDAPDRRRYLDELLDHLAEAVESLQSLRLLILIREEMLPELLSREATLADGFPARFRVPLLTRSDALKSVNRPLVKTGRVFAPGAADEFIDGLQTVDINLSEQKTTAAVELVEPLSLQVACWSLWRALPEQVTTISTDDVYRYRRAQTPAELYRQILREIARENRTEEASLNEWLRQNFITSFGTRATAYEGVSETSGMPNSIVRAFEDRHILRSEMRFGARWYELGHDLLIEPIEHAYRARFGGNHAKASPSDHLRTAESALTNGQLDLAEKHAEAAVCLSRNDDLRIAAEAESFLGQTAYLRGQLAEAERHYRHAAEHFETLQDKAAVGRVLATIGRLLLGRQPYADAVDALQAAVARRPGDIEVQMDLARALWFAGDLTAATAVSGGVLTSAPGAPEALAERGQILIERDDPVAALEDLDHVLRLNPVVGLRAEVRAARALALARIGRLKEAVAEADAAVKDAPNSGPVLLCASEVARVAGESSLADELLRRARDARQPKLRPYQLAEVHSLMTERTLREADSQATDR